jgi:hypothetical protein
MIVSPDCVPLLQEPAAADCPEKAKSRTDYLLPEMIIGVLPGRNQP